jgi:hypothetical protein
MAIHYANNTLLLAKETHNQELINAMRVQIHNAKELGNEFVHELKNIDTIVSLSENAVKSEIKPS